MALLLLFGGALAAFACLLIGGAFFALAAMNNGPRWFGYVLAAFFAALAISVMVAVGTHLDIRMT